MQRSCEQLDGDQEDVTDINLARSSRADTTEGSEGFFAQTSDAASVSAAVSITRGELDRHLDRVDAQVKELRDDVVHRISEQHAELVQLLTRSR